MSRAPMDPGEGHPRLGLVFTVDYEIHGNGEGCPLELMVRPTGRLLDLLEGFGARLTIMADTAEILKFREHRDSAGRDDWGYEAIERQLCDAVARGHDVQLHLHPSYSRAHPANGRWALEYGDYDLARLGYPRIFALVKEGKEYLEGLLRPVRPSYHCHAFRAANWSMCPSADTVRALQENGFRIDTSVFKYGFRNELVSFDYADAESDTVPWPVDAADVCHRDDGGRIFEFPIYCENRPIWAFLSLNRFYRMILDRMHPLAAAPGKAGRGGKAAGSGRKRGSALSAPFRRHAWKLDFNQCSGRQLISGLRRAWARYGGLGVDLPVVLIGHSKLFSRFNEAELAPFLAYVASRPADFRFGTFDQFDLEQFRRQVAAA